MLKNQKGQALVEFALCIPILFGFCFGLITSSLWGISGLMAQSIAHEGARTYATSTALTNSEAEQKGENVATDYMNRWGHIVVFPDKTKVTVQKADDTATCSVTVYPRINNLCGFKVPFITRESTSTLEYVWRDPSRYKK